MGFRPIVRDPKIHLETTSVIKAPSLKLKLKNLIPRDSHHPRLFVFPEIQKSNIPLWSIVNLLGSSSNAIAKNLANILKTL